MQASEEHKELMERVINCKKRMDDLNIVFCTIDPEVSIHDAEVLCDSIERINNENPEIKTFLES